MGAKPTLGPWHIDWNGGMAPRILGKSWIGNIREIAEVKFHNGSDDPEVHSNARLIAAAPEMYEALEEAARYIEIDCPGCDGETKDHDPTCLAVRDALDKAGG